MNNFKKKAVAAAVGSALGLALTTAPAQAAPTYTGCSSSTFCTINDLLGGGSISMNGVTFDNFSFGFSSGSVNFSTIVIGDDSDPLNLGLQYGAAATGNLSSIVAFGAFDYSFTVDSSATNLLLKDASLELTNWSADNVDIFQDLFDGGDNFIDGMNVGVADGIPNLTDAIVYAPTDFVAVDMALASDAWIDGFEQYFSLEVDQPPVDTPEPGTLALLGAGLAGFGLTRRRKKKA